MAEPKEGVFIMTDPGGFSLGNGQEEVTQISAVLITHEHGDHLHIESLKKILKNNPDATVITNSSVGKLLDEAGIPYKTIEDGQYVEIKGVTIKGFGNIHAEIYEEMGRVQNTGYMIESLCYPGDAFEDPKEDRIDILALPVVGPWMRMKDALLYAQKLKPRITFPVHDGFINELGAFISKWPETVLPPVGIKFKKLELGKVEDL